ncbi:hypothetical protein ATANTOWER_032584, partial [Ataeniobius toweri]|nr:hypothetical protein [Ataeniobius toweri]
HQKGYIHRPRFCCAPGPHERRFIGINSERGTKTSHGKMVFETTGKIIQRKQQTVNAPVSTLIKNLMDFEWHFIQ